jgi:hypothetical protein
MKLFQAAIVAAGIVLIAGVGPALAAGLSPAQCQKLESEYAQLQQKQKNGTATAADKKRMKQIDDQTNVYCS